MRRIAIAANVTEVTMRNRRKGLQILLDGISIKEF